MVSIDNRRILTDYHDYQPFSLWPFYCMPFYRQANISRTHIQISNNHFQIKIKNPKYRLGTTTLDESLTHNLCHVSLKGLFIPKIFLAKSVVNMGIWLTPLSALCPYPYQFMNDLLESYKSSYDVGIEPVIFGFIIHAYSIF